MGAPVKRERLYEFEFVNVRTGIKRAWGEDVYEALNSLGFNDPKQTMVSVVREWREVAEVTL